MLPHELHALSRVTPAPLKKRPVPSATMPSKSPEAVARDRQRVRDRRADPAKWAQELARRRLQHKPKPPSTTEQREKERLRGAKLRATADTRAKQREYARKNRAKARAADPDAYLQKNAERRKAFCSDGTPKVYFVQAESGPIKIGFTTVRMVARIQTLQCGTYEQLMLLGTMTGSRDLEKQLHDRFEADRIRNEWFRPSTELLEFIRSATTS